MKTNLRHLRQVRHMTQLQLQLQTGIDQALISKYESGERIIPTDTLITLADFFNVSMDYVIGRSDDDSPWK